MLEEYSITLDDLTSILTALIALAGLGLSVYNLRLARRDKQIQLKSKLSHGFLPRGADLGELMLILEVSNPGEKLATITSVGLQWKKRSIAFIHGIPGTTQIPFELPVGKNETFWTPVRELARTLKDENAKGRVRLHAQFRTAISTEHVSKKLVLDVDK
jgi:hypothetical protein